MSEWGAGVPTWRAPVSHRNALTTIISVFRHGKAELDIRNPIKGLKEPPQRPRLYSISPEEGSLLSQCRIVSQ